MMPDPRDPITTEDQFHRRYWRFTNRPYGGCGCLWLGLIALMVYLLLSIVLTPLRFGYW